MDEMRAMNAFLWVPLKNTDIFTKATINFGEYILDEYIH